MADQWVLRGASCATPRSHARLTYRNFFPSDARWAFAGSGWQAGARAGVALTAPRPLADADAALRDEVLAGLCAHAARRSTRSCSTTPPAPRSSSASRRCREYYRARRARDPAGTSPRCGGSAGRARLVEYGSGAGAKVRLLLDAFAPAAAAAYADRHLARAAGDGGRRAGGRYPAVPVRPVCADYTAPLRIPDLPERARRIAFFPGSTIGNFHPTEAAAFLRRVRRTVGADGALVLGIDRRKDASVLRAAYDDAAGVTAAFNLNLLTRLNRELGADFDRARFRHRAVWNDDASRIEMHLESVAAHVVHVAGTPVRFAAGETIWTESSYKYDRPRLDRLVAEGGFALTRLWSDADDRFWVAFLTAAGEPAQAAPASHATDAV
jgi:dimethylhistidine N-methyltransferase